MRKYIVAVYVTGMLALATEANANAQTTISPAYSDAQAQLAVAPLIPQAITSVPPSPTPTGTAGSGLTYVPGNAAIPALTRATTVITGTGGTFAVTWAVPLVSATPVINLIPINTSGSQPVICNVTARASATVAGTCYTTQTASLNLSIVTAGVNLNPTATAVSGMSIMVLAREPTQ